MTAAVIMLIVAAYMLGIVSGLWLVDVGVCKETKTGSIKGAAGQCRYQSGSRIVNDATPSVRGHR